MALILSDRLYPSTKRVYIYIAVSHLLPCINPLRRPKGQPGGRAGQARPARPAGPAGPAGLAGQAGWAGRASQGGLINPPGGVDPGGSTPPWGG